MSVTTTTTHYHHHDQQQQQQHDVRALFEDPEIRSERQRSLVKMHDSKVHLTEDLTAR